jgi:hypothetical protein
LCAGIKISRIRLGARGRQCVNLARLCLRNFQDRPQLIESAHCVTPQRTSRYVPSWQRCAVHHLERVLALCGLLVLENMTSCVVHLFHLFCFVFAIVFPFSVLVLLVRRGTRRYSDTINAPACKAWSQCSEGEYAAASPTAKADRLCLPCPTGR